MRRKQMLVLLIVLLVIGGVVGAAIPSMFEASLISSYTIEDLADTDFAAYSPGVRLGFYVNEWFGLSGEALLVSPFAESTDTYRFILSTDLVFRWPLGFVEPYLGIGPSYDVRITSGDIDFMREILYSARLGFDFNITPVLALGVEAQHIIPDLPGLLASPGNFDVMKNTHIGLIVKAKL
jgi:hypothetical protein